MARPKSWFPVGHSFLDDPEVDELYSKFGYGGIRLWLKILSLSDQKENYIKVDPYLIKKLSEVARQRLPSTWLTLSWMLAKGWLTASQHLASGQEEVSKDLPNTFVGSFSLPKYAEYHRTRLPNQSLNGDKLAPNRAAPNLSYPNLPNLPKEKNKKETVFEEKPEGGELGLEVAKAEIFSATPEKLISLFNSVPYLKPTLTLNDATRKTVLARIKEHPEMAWWEDLIERLIKPSDFLCGRKTDFAASLTWVCGPKNMGKILAGEYAPKNGHPGGPTGSATCPTRLKRPGKNYLETCGEPGTEDFRGHKLCLSCFKEKEARGYTA